MSEVVINDHSIQEPTTAHLHPLESIPQGSQSEGVPFGHDHHDVNVSILGKSVIGLMALIVVSFIICWYVTHGIINALQKSDAVPSATYAERANLKASWPIPPIVSEVQEVGEAPDLQPDPEKPMVMLREQQEAQLYSNNWRKDEQGRKVGVSLNIERAMELTLERGLPSGEVVALGEVRPSETVMREENLKLQNKKATESPKH
jgi:hypothetical protein